MEALSANSKRFTLMELLIVVGIIAFLATVGLGLSAVLEERVKEDTVRRFIDQIETALVQYQIEGGSVQTLENLSNRTPASYDVNNAEDLVANYNNIVWVAPNDDSNKKVTLKTGWYNDNLYSVMKKQGVVQPKDDMVKLKSPPWNFWKSEITWLDSDNAQENEIERSGTPKPGIGTTIWVAHPDGSKEWLKAKIIQRQKKDLDGDLMTDENGDPVYYTSLDAVSGDVSAAFEYVTDTGDQETQILYVENVRKRVIWDPFNQCQFRFRTNGHNAPGIDVWSPGPDRKSGTEDDITNWKRH